MSLLEECDAPAVDGLSGAAFWRTFASNSSEVRNRFMLVADEGASVSAAAGPDTSVEKESSEEAEAGDEAGESDAVAGEGAVGRGLAELPWRGITGSGTGVCEMARAGGGFGAEAGSEREMRREVKLTGRRGSGPLEGPWAGQVGVGLGSRNAVARRGALLGLPGGALLFPGLVQGQDAAMDGQELGAAHHRWRRDGGSPRRGAVHGGEGGRPARGG